MGLRRLCVSRGNERKRYFKRTKKEISRPKRFGITEMCEITTTALNDGAKHYVRLDNGTEEAKCTRTNL